MFDGKRVLSELPYPNFGEDRETQQAIAEGSGRLSISGAQEKYAMVVGVTQQEVANLASVGINSLVAIERGKGNPSLKTLLRILEVLGLEIKLG